MIDWGARVGEEKQVDSDGALMRRVASGDQAAFELLVLKYQKAVINTSYRYTGNPSVAEELAQEVFVRVYRAAASYRPEARFTTWLFTIVRNVCSNYRSREGRHDQQMDPEADPSFAVQQNDPQTSLLRRELQQTIRKAVAELPESLRIPFILSQFEHLEYEDIAEVMRISLALVKVRIHRARQLLARKLLPLRPQDM